MPTSEAQKRAKKKWDDNNPEIIKEAQKIYKKEKIVTVQITKELLAKLDLLKPILGVTSRPAVIAELVKKASQS